MKLTPCTRCNQPRNPADLVLGKCAVCRRHKCQKHAAGDPTCYSFCKCRCDPCLDAGRARAKFTGHLRSAGTPILRDARAARDRIALLKASGMGTAEIERRSGVHRVSLLAIERGEVEKVRVDTGRAILSVHPVSIHEQTTGRVPAAGTRRRIHALMAVGWSLNKIAEHAGLTTSQTGRLSTAADLELCFANTRARIAKTYDVLWDQAPADDRGHGPARVRNMAKAAGWAPPAAWDEGFGPHGIDNPKAVPDLADGPLRRKGETAREVRRMLGTDNAEGIAERLGYADLDSLLTTLKRTDKPLAGRLAATRTEAA